MNKIAFYLNNNTMRNDDYSSIVNGNPGLAGSEYEFLLIPYLLERRGKVIPYLLVNFEGTFPHNNVFRVSDLRSCCKWCQDNNIKNLVVDVKYIDLSLFTLFKELNFIIWAHNNLKYSQLNKIFRLKNIKRIVNCGREELELYRDHITTLKSTYIYNIFPFKPKSFYQSKIEYNDNHNVVYMGSITKEKGFHVLARSWKKVIKEVPDAQLFVIGSGKLYNNNAILGKYGIAEAKYEKLFMRYICDKNGNILPSVHFLGLLKDEKYDILGKSKVGVPNPTGISECLPITSIEMQLMGCNITTIKHASYYDTVYNKDYLYNRESDLSHFIIKRLLGKRDNYDELYDYVTTRFGVEGNIERWEDLVLNINNPQIEEISIYNYQCKKLKDFLLKVKRKYPIFRHLLCVEQIFLFIEMFKHLISRIEYKDYKK